jgi:hypothetical protein
MKKILMLISASLLLVSCACSESDSESNPREYGKYTSPGGGRQKEYKGSVEQMRDLQMIDSYDW